MCRAGILTRLKVLQPLASTPLIPCGFECLPLCTRNPRSSRTPIPQHQVRSSSSHPPPTSSTYLQHHHRPHHRPSPRAPHSTIFTKSPFHTTSTLPTTNPPPFRSTSHKPPRDHDRGPTSKEDTQTDFAALNVLGSAIIPTTSVDICEFDGFLLDSGLRIGDGDGVLLVGAEAFVWRPWMAAASPTPTPAGEHKVVTGRMLGTGGRSLINVTGQWEVGEHAWGLLKAVWPKPDILVIGTGPQIRPLAPATRRCLQELGMRVEVLDTRNAAAQFNLLATERGVLEVAAALVPIGFGL